MNRGYFARRSMVVKACAAEGPDFRPVPDVGAGPDAGTGMRGGRFAI